jgi:anaerobic ribonucleoside-triphosphate reductase activating protein
MKYQQIVSSDISNGPGVRVSLFVSGCTLRCKGCHNPEAWNFESGTEFTNETIDLILEQVGKSYIQGLSILGGEPFDQRDFPMLVKLVRRFKFFYPDKDIWI